MAYDIEIKGLKELYDQLQQLPVKIEQNVMRGALRAGGKVFQDAAKLRCPEGEPGGTAAKRYGAVRGELRNSIRVSVFAKAGTVIARVRAGNKKAWYAHLVEFGTGPHLERSQFGKEMWFHGMFRKVIHHPGAQPEPFMRPAFDGYATAAVEAVRDYIRDRLPKEFSKLI